MTMLPEGIVERFESGSQQDGKLRIYLYTNNAVRVSILNDAGITSVTFDDQLSSPRTVAAIRQLAMAMAFDNMDPNQAVRDSGVEFTGFELTVCFCENGLTDAGERCPYCNGRGAPEDPKGES